VSRRGWLWIAFVLVHVWVAYSGFVMRNIPMGDVYLVYEPWARAAFAGHHIVGVTEEWVYPQLALVPMMLALVLEPLAGYEVAWALVVTIADALAFALLVGRGRSRGRTVAAWFWLAYILALGPVGMYRLDGVTVPLALAGALWLVGRPLLASALLSIATWMKVWPAALLAAAVIALRRRAAVIAGALAVSTVVLALILAAGGGAYAFGFVAGQNARGLQIEAPATTPFMWMAALQAPDSFVFYDREILTFEVAAPGVDAVAAAMMSLLVLAVLVIAALGAVKAWRGAAFASLFPPLALSIVLALIVFNKVGSPQFVTWLIAPLALGLVIDRRRWTLPALGALLAALLTQIVYPIVYDLVITAVPAAVAVLTVRNLLFVALFAWALARLARVPHRVRHPEPVQG